MKTYVYAVENRHCNILDGVVFQNRNEACHAIHMVCDAYYDRDFNLMSRHRYNNWLSKIIEDYWAGDYDKSTANKLLKEKLKRQSKYRLKDIWATAVYWDFYRMFFINEKPIVDNMERLRNNIKECKNKGELQ